MSGEQENYQKAPDSSTNNLQSDADGVTNFASLAKGTDQGTVIQLEKESVDDVEVNPPQRETTELILGESKPPQTNPL